MSTKASDTSVQTNINSNEHADDGNETGSNINSKLTNDGTNPEAHASEEVQDKASTQMNEDEAKLNSKLNSSSSEATYSILEKLQDMEFRLSFNKMLININPNVNWMFELKAISEQHKSDVQIIKLLRSRSWIDQDIEPEYDYADIFRQIHETFNPIILEHLESQFESIELRPSFTKSLLTKPVKTSKPKLRIRILDVDMKALPPKLELNMYIWKKRLIDFFTISNIEYEFASPSEYELIGSIPRPDEPTEEVSISTSSISINSSTNINMDEHKSSNDKPSDKSYSDKSYSDKSYKDMSNVDLYRFNFGWESFPTWNEPKGDEKRLDFIWNGIDPSGKYSTFLRDLLISVYTLPSEIEE